MITPRLALQASNSILLLNIGGGIALNGFIFNEYVSDAPFDLDAPIPFGRAVVGNEDRALIANTGPGTRAEPVRVW
jgi:hypothetical protein